MGMDAITELHGSGVRESEPLTRSGLGRPDAVETEMVAPRYLTSLYVRFCELQTWLEFGSSSLEPEKERELSTLRKYLETEPEPHSSRTRGERETDGVGARFASQREAIYHAL
jgi:hypothetical protein